MGSKITDDLLGIDPPQLPEPPAPPPPPTVENKKKDVEAAGATVRNRFSKAKEELFSNGYQGFQRPPGQTLARKTLLGK